MAIRAADREGRRSTLSVRLTPEGRSRLEQAASASDRSLAQEVEFRLERSFREGDIYAALLGSRKNADVVKMISTILLITRNKKGEDWTQSPEVCNIVAEAFRELMLAGYKDSSAYELSYETENWERESKKISKIKHTGSGVASSAAVMHTASKDAAFAEGRDLSNPNYAMEQFDEPDEPGRKLYRLMFQWGRE